MASQAGTFNVQELTDSGAPLVGGRLYTYSYGTTTQKDAYTDADGVIPQTYTSDGAGGQYIALDSRGELPAPLYLATGSYDLALKRADGSTVWTRRAEGTLGLAVLAGTSGASLVGWTGPYTGAVARTVQDRLRETVSVKDFGAVGDGSTDDTTAIQNAINNVASSTVPLTLFFPRGTYRITSQITTPTGAIVHLLGEGPGSTIIRQDSTTAGGISFDCNLVQGGSVRGMTIKGNSTLGTGSTGIGLDINQCNDNFAVERVDITNFATSCRALGCWALFITQFRFLQFQDYGLHIGPSGTGGDGVGGDLIANMGVISNNGFTGTNTASIGIFSECSGGDMFSNIDITVTANGVVLRPATGYNILYNFFTNVLADTCIGNCWVLDSTSGKVWSVHMTNVWGAFSTNGIGLVNTGVNTADVVVMNSRFRENGLQGVLLSTGGIRFTGCAINSNSKLTSNTYDGVSIDAGVSDWSFVDCKIGNFASSTIQANGIRIAVGASANFQIIGCDLSNPGSGMVPIASGTSTQSYVIRDNLPIQGSGVNNTRGALYPGNSVGTVAAASTLYLGPNGAQANELDNLVIAGRPGVITQVLVIVDNAPGAAQTYTYTLRKNGADTALTGSISGTATFSLLLNASPITVGGTDNFSLKLVTSASATVTRHRWSVAIDS